MLYLLQLVQALRFESSASDQRSTRTATPGGISYDDSGLADFLITRAVANPILGNHFHWYLMVEVGLEDRVMAKMYARVDWNFMRKVEEVSGSVLLNHLVYAYISTSPKAALNAVHSCDVRQS
jgi:phosphatidylinositol 3-kinase